MILLVKKSNLLFGALVVALVLTILGINLGLRGGGESVSAAAVPTLNSSGKVIVLDAGHGGEDPGAVSSNGTKEKDITLILANKTKALLEKAGYKVIMTRTEDMLVYEGDNISMTSKRRQDLLTRKKIMDESGADIVVSIHLNSYTDPKYSGAQTFYTKESQSGKQLATAIQNALKTNVDPDNEREALKKAEDIIITKNCKTTTVIVECGFLSNVEESEKLINEEYQNKLAEAIKLGIDDYFTVMKPSDQAK